MYYLFCVTLPIERMHAIIALINNVQIQAGAK